jgi:hypothetical protein
VEAVVLGVVDVSTSWPDLYRIVKTYEGNALLINAAKHYLYPLLSKLAS